MLVLLSGSDSVQLASPAPSSSSKTITRPFENENESGTHESIELSTEQLGLAQSSKKIKASSFNETVINDEQPTGGFRVYSGHWYVEVHCCRHYMP